MQNSRIGAVQVIDPVGVQSPTQPRRCPSWKPPDQRAERGAEAERVEHRRLDRRQHAAGEKEQQHRGGQREAGGRAEIERHIDQLVRQAQEAISRAPLAAGWPEYLAALARLVAYREG